MLTYFLYLNGIKNIAYLLLVFIEMDLHLLFLIILVFKTKIK